MIVFAKRLGGARALASTCLKVNANPELTCLAFVPIYATTMVSVCSSLSNDTLFVGNLPTVSTSQAKPLGSESHAVDADAIDSSLISQA